MANGKLDNDDELDTKNQSDTDSADDTESPAATATPMPSVSAPSSPMPDPRNYMVSADELQANAATHRRNALLGAISDNLSNRQSAGNFMLGHMNPKQSSAGMVESLDQAADAPIQQKQKLLAQTLKQPEYDYISKNMDPNSDVVQQKRNALKASLTGLKQVGMFKSNPQVLDRISSNLDNMSGVDIDRLVASNKWLNSGAEFAVKEDQNQRMLDRMYAMMGNRNSNQAQHAVNNDPVLKTYVQRIDGAQKIDNLIDAASKGDVKSNQALLGQLNAEISRLETGSQSPGLGQAEKTEMNDARAKLQNMYDTLTGKVTSVNLGDKFSAAKSMIQDLGGSYYDQIGNRIGFLKSGSQPDQMPVFDAKSDYFKNAYKGFARSPQQGMAQNQGPAPAGNGGYAVIPSANAGDGSGSVRVVSPEGKMGIIPAANLQKALQRGFKRAE